MKQKQKTLKKWNKFIQKGFEEYPLEWGTVLSRIGLVIFGVMIYTAIDFAKIENIIRLFIANEAIIDAFIPPIGMGITVWLLWYPTILAIMPLIIIFLGFFWASSNKILLYGYRNKGVKNVINL